MTIFSRLFGRRRKDTTARVKTRPGKTLLGFEPLEERRMLDCSLAYDLQVNNVLNLGTGHEDEVKLTWQDFGTGGYEIQSSVNGLDWEGSPEPWKTGLWQTIETIPAGIEIANLPRYRSLYYRIRAVSELNWSCPEYTSTASEDNVVKVSAVATNTQQETKITLSWPEEIKFLASEYTISRKAKDDVVWVERDTDYSGFDWEDNITAAVDPIEVGKAYEYRVERCSTAGCASHTATGYIYAAIELPLSDADSTIESPGTVILIVDNTQAEALETELIRLEDDLYAEGWDVIRHDVVRDTAVSPTLDYTNQTLVDGQRADLAAAITIRDMIIEDYDASYDSQTETYGVKSVFLFGHVPIPMSGYDNPDGHGTRPFPADVFYGEMDGVWQRGADGASSVGVIGGGERIPRKYLTRASDSDIVQVTRRDTLLATAI